MGRWGGRFGEENQTSQAEVGFVFEGMAEVVKGNASIWMFVFYL